MITTSTAVYVRHLRLLGYTVRGIARKLHMTRSDVRRYLTQA